MDPASSIAESSQSIIPPSEEPEHEKFDMVEAPSQTRRMVYTELLGQSSGLILLALIMSDFMVIKRVMDIAEFYKFYTSMDVDDFNDTQSSEEDSICVLLMIFVVLL